MSNAEKGRAKGVAHAAILAAIVFAVFALKLVDAQSKPVFSHDGGISILSATGNQADYADISADGLTNAWVEARRFTAFVEAPPVPDYASIASDLNRHDIHPPLYFWSLGTWTSLAAVDSPRLYFVPNVIFACLSILVFYVLMRHRFPASAALAFSAVFAFAPALAAPMMALRQYELMMLASALLLLSLTHASPHVGRSRASAAAAAVGIFLGTFVGLMTQMQFALFALAAVVSVVLAKYPLRRVVLSGASVMAAAGAFLVLNWDFTQAFLRHRDQLPQTGLDGVVGRIKRIATAATDLFGMEPLVAAAVLFAILALATHGVVRRPASPSTDRLWFAFCVLPLSLYFVLYLTSQVPPHAIGSRYFLPFLPGIMAALAIFISRARSRTLEMFLAAFMTLTSVSMTIAAVEDRVKQRQDLQRALSDASALFINNSARGIFTPILPFIPADRRVFVADAQYDDEASREMLAELRSGDVVLLRSGYSVTQETTERQRDLLSARFQLSPVGVGQLYVLR